MYPRLCLISALVLASCPRRAPVEAVEAAGAGERGTSSSFTASAELPIRADAPLGRHSELDLCFPTLPPEGWRFTGTHHFTNPDGMDMMWGYVHDDGTIVSVYGYPGHGDPPEGLSRAEFGLRASAAKVSNVEWTGSAQLGSNHLGGSADMVWGVQKLDLGPLLAPDLHAKIAASLGLPSLDGVLRDVGAMVVVWDYDGSYVKMRVTWLDVDRSPEDVMRSLMAWSVFPCASLPGGALPVVDVPPEGLPGRAE